MDAEHPNLKPRVRHILRSLGLPATPLEPVESFSNAVWLTPDHAIHYHVIGPPGRLEHEARIAARLPPDMPYPPVVAVGRDGEHDWLVAQRLPGIPLSEAWPRLAPSERRDAVYQAAGALRALHRAPAQDLVPPCLQRGEPIPTRQALVARLLALGLPLPRNLLLAAGDGPLAMAHGDFSFNQILWHEGRVTALLDLEMAHAESPDWDLGTFLAFCHDPVRMVPTHLEPLSRPADYRDAPGWLHEAYPELFSSPLLPERLVLQALVLRSTELLAQPARWAELLEAALEWARTLEPLIP